MLLQSSEDGASPGEVTGIFNEFVDGIVGAIPQILTGILFLVLAYLLISAILTVVRWVLERIYPPSENLVVDLLVTVIAGFLWFGAILGLLNAVGLGAVAASLGTASGFIGLGIALALREMIADTVAGVYLLRDPDFSEGDSVKTADVEGTLVSIDLRKTRIQTGDGDLVVLANRDVEKKWVRHADRSEAATAT